MDQTLFHLINGQWTSPALDLFMAALSDSEIWNPLLIAIVLSALFFGGFKARSFMVCLLLSLLIGELFTSVLKSAIDRVTKGATEIHDVVQETSHSLFRSIRSEPLRTLVSIGTCHEQHDRRSISDAFLSATWLALLGRRRSCWLLENLPWRALAERRDCDPVFGDW